MSTSFQPACHTAGVPPKQPDTFPEITPPEPGPDIFPEPLPDVEPIPEQDPDLPEPGQVTPPIVAGSAEWLAHHGAIPKCGSVPPLH